MATIENINASNRKVATWNLEELQAQLRLYDRSPFIDLLTEWLAQSPELEDIADLASKDPARWVKAVTEIAKIAGFSEKKEVHVGVHVDVRQLSDSQLEDRLRQLLENAKSVPLKVIEGSANVGAPAEPSSDPDGAPKEPSPAAS